VGGSVNGFTIFDEDAAGANPPALFVGGSFTTAGGVMARRIARWDGLAWSSLGEGVDAPVFTTVRVFALGVLSAGPSEPALYIGGDFTSVSGIPANRVARWDAEQWSALSPEVHGHNGFVRAVIPIEDANGEALIVGGQFTTADGLAVNRIARLGFGPTGAPTGWSALGQGMTSGQGLDFGVLALTVFDEDGDGPNSPRLFAGGSFTVVDGQPISFIARWDPDTSAWSAVGDGVSAAVHALTVYDPDGPGPALPRLIAGGTFSMAGGAPANNVAQWDGASWSPLGSGVNGVVNAMAAYDHDGDGPATPRLVVGGTFISVGGVQMPRIAQWDGAAWSPLGAGMNHIVHALTVHDPDGAGPGTPRLVAGGQFGVAGGVIVNGIAQWNGFSWAAFGSGMNNVVHAVASIDEDGAGPNAPRLMAGGFFSIAGGISASRIARWDGSSWSALGAGTNNVVYALAALDTDGPGTLPPALFAGGAFEQAGGRSSAFFGAWGCLPPVTPAGDLDGDGDVDHADWAIFAGCLTGPGVVASPECLPADLDGDADVDLKDAAAFTQSFTGS
jgi:hypothetical protein